jgi:GTP-binding protein
MLIDSAIILVSSGKGGNGVVSWRREKYIPMGGPAGGDGGKGGDAILLAETGIDTLLDFAGRHHWDAPRGEDGGRKQKAGRDAEDLIIKLPPGTLVYDAETGELIIDLDTPGKSLVICKGGKGGFGNEHFKSSTNQAPIETEPGGESETRKLRLELKLIADVGLLGKPNAGKSTLISRISKAHPKIADYPFTTLEPNLGIAELQGYRRIVFADLPGLIEGASQGAGLGIQFLRHVERTRLLLHLIEVDPIDGSDPIENYRVIRKELAEYSQELAEKPEIIAVSKLDLLPTEEDRATAMQLIQEAIGKPTFAISAATGKGLTELLEACWEKLGKAAAVPSQWGRNEEAAAQDVSK